MEKIDFCDKRLERSVVQLSARAADAAELGHHISMMSSELEKTLVWIQKELEELYLSLGHKKKELQ